MGAEKSAPRRGREKPAGRNQRARVALAVNIWQLGTVAPCLALDAILNPTLGLGAIGETAKGDSLAREPIDNDRDPLVALVNERDFSLIQHKQPFQKLGGARAPPVMLRREIGRDTFSQTAQLIFNRSRWSERAFVIIA
jgi:hypothetical protein